MAANIEQNVVAILEKFPALRCSTNLLCLGYWMLIDGWPEKQKDFYQTTPLESIVREAREVWKRRPELSPTANPKPTSPRPQVFQELLDLFPGSEEVHDALGRTNLR